MTSPLVTIILPAYNGAKWIDKAIQSALNQTFNDYEFIIINDCSTDKTEEVALRFAVKDNRIKYLKNTKNVGIQVNRNIALSHAKGKYIAEIDQDDEWIDPKKLEKQIKFMEEHPDCVLIGTGAIMVDENGKELARYLMPETDEQIRKKFLRANRFIHSSVVYRLAAVMSVGGYEPDMMSEDHDLWLRLGRVGTFRNLPEYSTQYMFRMSGYNSADKIARLRQNMLIAKKNKKFYPNYFSALVLGWLKIIFWPIFKILPRNIQGIFLGVHKKL